MSKNQDKRLSVLERNTNETKITVKVNLDGQGLSNINTGLPFFDHMLEQLSKHSLIDIDLNCYGDLHIDSHHTVEDVGWALGSAINKALGNKKGIKRYSFSYLPMDECLTRCSIDVSGRPWLVWKVFLPTISIKNIETEIFKEFFQSFSQSASLTLHIENLYGTNTHHIIESCFKSLAVAIRGAISIDLMNKENIPSTKGTLS
ncbi:imidazoleglycerol-phosphate dehydratase HisB [Alphaproteobacteria bacterium]|jgi:imidazoleglycerol-phosphate dehydratase|nr:imidazoleglycerol-phosphate dehydratase HisB [Alphaproteobacteria bacterium]MDC6452752.1 imidazoleglycerol-phosphate dehydratase HisB [Alphaproteobacteria bacterium]